MRRAHLTVSRDALGKHYDLLTDDERKAVIELIALQVLENEEMKERMK